jgi:hypothetical protein
MTRRLLVGLLAALGPAELEADHEPITIEVGPGKRLTVTVPDIKKADLVSLVADMFMSGDKAAKARFENLIDQAPSLTLILKSRL